jgi:hypothetical protein
LAMIRTMRVYDCIALGMEYGKEFLGLFWEEFEAVEVRRALCLSS